MGRILVADDHDALRRGIARALANEWRRACGLIPSRTEQAETYRRTEEKSINAARRQPPATVVRRQRRQRVLDIVRKVSKSNTTVLIRGETGTGKELIRSRSSQLTPRRPRRRRARSRVRLQRVTVAQIAPDRLGRAPVERYDPLPRKDHAELAQFFFAVHADQPTVEIGIFDIQRDQLTQS